MKESPDDLLHFQFRGKRYAYYRSRKTRFNERAVELPIVKRELDRCEVSSILGKTVRILEVGNVFHKHYSKHPPAWPVVDLYEKPYHHVINEDITKFETSERYDLVVSVSTLEHVGFDYQEKRDPARCRIAVERIRTLLKPGGRLIVTCGFGYNRNWDRMVVSGEIEFDRLDCMIRVSSQEANQWVEAPLSEASEKKYKRRRGASLQTATGLMIGEIDG